eukprot:SAG22_NODE_8025_length_690_cov_0.708968_1_plen_50_part_10
MAVGLHATPFFAGKPGLSYAFIPGSPGGRKGPHGPHVPGTCAAVRIFLPP